jgi:hypothetical protein
MQRAARELALPRILLQHSESLESFSVSTALKNGGKLERKYFFSKKEMFEDTADAKKVLHLLLAPHYVSIEDKYRPIYTPRMQRYRCAYFEKFLADIIAI